MTLIKENYKGNIDWSDISISDIKKELTDLENKGFTFVNIFNDDGYLCYNVYFERDETDKEVEDRISLGLIRNEKIKKKDMRKFEEIKLKYNL